MKTASKLAAASFPDFHLVSAAAPAVGLLLDTLGSPVPYAFSVRRLRTGYAGPCMAVARFGETALQDIGFDANGNLDEAALVAYSNNGASGVAVGLWYNQGADAGVPSFTQQPFYYPVVISASGAVQRFSSSNNVIGLGWNGQNAGLTGPVTVGGTELSVYAAFNNAIPPATAYARIFSFLALGQANDHDNDGSILCGTINSGGQRAGIHRNTAEATAPASQGPHSISAVSDGTNSTYAENGVDLASFADTRTFAASGQFYVGSSNENLFVTGSFGEVIIQPAANANDRAAVLASQRAYFGI